MNKRSYGEGRVFLNGNLWWISYCINGKERRESSRSTSRAEAKKLLRRRLGEKDEGKLIITNQHKVKFDNLIELLLLNHEVNGRTETVKFHVKHLRRFFGFERVTAITNERLLQYVKSRREKGAADASIKLELAALSKAFNLAIQAKKLYPDARPIFPKIKLDNARKGFLEYPQFLQLLANLPENLRDPVNFLYQSGWRISEMRKIEWLHLDATTLVLPPALSKSKHARRLPLEGELAEIIKRAREHRRLDQPRIFHRNGRPIGDFRKLWQKACVAVELGHWIEDNDSLPAKPKWKIRRKYRGLIVHDLRRSCVRNLVRSGLSEKIAMDQTGHKTRSVFERYNIVNDRDRIEAQQRYQTYLAEQQRAAVAVFARNKQVNSDKIRLIR